MAEPNELTLQYPSLKGGSKLPFYAFPAIVACRGDRRRFGSTETIWTKMNSRDLRPSDDDTAEPASNEVHFALVIARMLDTVKNDPEHMRQVVYDLARYKLQEQFTLADAKDV